MVERRQLHMHTRNFIFLFSLSLPFPLFFLFCIFFWWGGGATTPTAPLATRLNLTPYSWLFPRTTPMNYEEELTCKVDSHVEHLASTGELKTTIKTLTKIIQYCTISKTVERKREVEIK